MSDPVLMTLIASIGTLGVALCNLLLGAFVAWIQNKKLDNYNSQVNGQLSELKDALGKIAYADGKAQGKSDEQDRAAASSDRRKS